MLLPSEQLSRHPFDRIAIVGAAQPLFCDHDAQACMGSAVGLIIELEICTLKSMSEIKNG